MPPCRGAHEADLQVLKTRETSLVAGILGRTYGHGHMPAAVIDGTGIAMDAGPP